MNSENNELIPPPDLRTRKIEETARFIDLVFNAGFMLGSEPAPQVGFILIVLDVNSPQSNCRHVSNLAAKMNVVVLEEYSAYLRGISFGEEPAAAEPVGKD